MLNQINEDKSQDGLSFLCEERRDNMVSDLTFMILMSVKSFFLGSLLSISIINTILLRKCREWEDGGVYDNEEDED